MGRKKHKPSNVELYDKFILVSSNASDPKKNEYKCPNSSCPRYRLLGHSLVGRGAVSSHLNQSPKCMEAWQHMRRLPPPAPLPQQHHEDEEEDNDVFSGTFLGSEPSSDDDGEPLQEATKGIAGLDDWLTFEELIFGCTGDDDDNNQTDEVAVDHAFLELLSSHSLTKEIRHATGQQKDELKAQLDELRQRTTNSVAKATDPLIGEDEPVYRGMWETHQKRKEDGFVERDLSRQEMHLLKLLHMLKGFPLHLFDKILSWALTAANDGVLTGEKANFPTRDKFIQKLRQRKGIDKLHPITTDIALPHAGISVPVTTFDAEEIFLSLLADQHLWRPENLNHYSAKEQFDLLSSPSDDVDFENLSDDYVYGDMHTGRISIMSHRLMKKKAYDLPIGIILAVDKTHLDVHGRCMVEPVMMSFSIFNRETRRSGSAWRIIGYIPNFNPLQEAKDPSEKNWDYHVVVDHIVSSLHTLMSHKAGSFWHFGGLGTSVAMKPYLHSILGDHEGHDKAVCHYTNRSLKVKNLCRICNTPTDRSDDPFYQFEAAEYRILEIEDIRSEAGAKKHSYRWIDKHGRMLCGYDKLFRGIDHDTFGVNLRAQTDVLHDLCKGDQQTAHSAFINVPRQSKASRTGALKKAKRRKDASSREEEALAKMFTRKKLENGKADMRLFSSRFKRVCERATCTWGVALTHQSDRGLPRSFFPQGSMSTEKLNARDYIGLILLDLLLLSSTLGDYLFGDLETPKNVEERGYKRLGLLGENGVDGWTTLFEHLLLMDAFERSPCITELARKQYHNFLVFYAENYKKTLGDIGGNAMKKIKFHSKTHRSFQMQQLGVPSNGDTEITECLHITESKQPGRNTQKRFEVLDQQSGKRWSENTVINLNFSDYQEILDSLVAPKKRSKANVYGHDLRGSSFHLTFGSRCSICYRNGKEELPALWHNAVLQEQLSLFFGQQVATRTNENLTSAITLHNSFHVDLDVEGEEAKRSFVFRAEPGRKDKRVQSPGWMDWAFVHVPELIEFDESDEGDEERDKLVPAHLLCFFSIHKDLNQEFSLEGGPSIGRQGTYVLCHLSTDFSNAEEEGQMTHRITKDYRGKDIVSGPGKDKANRNKRIEAMKKAPEQLTLYALPIGRIRGSCIVVPDIFPPTKRKRKANDNFTVGEDLVVSTVEYLMIEPPLTWQDMFEKHVLNNFNDKPRRKESSGNDGSSSSGEEGFASEAESTTSVEDMLASRGCCRKEVVASGSSSSEEEEEEEDANNESRFLSKGVASSASSSSRKRKKRAKG